MDPRRWRRIEWIFAAASARDATERQDFVAAECAGDEDLRREVLSLLAQQSQDTLLDRPASDLVAGCRLGPYELLEHIGAGGMGTVFKARDTRLDRIVAIKISTSQFNGHFATEARAVAALNHPNICTLHDVGPNYFVMEFIEGETLARRFARGPLPADLILRHGIEIASAVATAHTRGIVHRDLKPANIMLTASGAKVLDFGLAKFENQAGAAPDITRNAALVGTVAYMSPEQAEGRPADARSDIFSFGAMLYEMITGKHPFRRDSEIATLASIVRDNPEPISEVAQKAPAELGRVVERCLRKDPDRRFQTAGALQAELAEVKEALHAGRQTLPAGSRSRSRRWMWMGVTAAAALLTTAAFWWFRPTPPAEDLRAEVLTEYAGWEALPSLSPDGSKVAFVWLGEKQDNTDIYVKQIGAPGPPVRLTTNPAIDSAPAWSPDDRWIAFVREMNDRFELLLVPSLGGPERKLAEIFSVSTPPSWTPDAKWLVYSTADATYGPTNIRAVSVETGEYRRLTTARTAQVAGGNYRVMGDVFPAVSPDGRTLAFSRYKSSFVAELFSLPLTQDVRPGGPPARIVNQSCAMVMGLAWTADGQDIVYGCGSQRAYGLWRTSSSGRSNPRRLTYALPSASMPSIARGRPRLVYEWSVSNSNLWRLDTRTKERRMLIGSSQGQNRQPDYSRDGRRIAFQSNRSGSSELWACDAEGANCQQLTSFRGVQCGTPRWSPDGRWLVFDSRTEGQSEIYVMPADGGAMRRLTDHPANDVVPSWSQDGRWIYFSSDRTGRHEIWKTPVEGGEAVQVTRAGGFSALESSDGRRLFYLKSFNDPRDSLFSMPVEGGEETELAIKVGFWHNFGVTSKGIYFVHDGKRIRFLDFATGRVSTLATSDKALLGLAVSPDGAHVVVAQDDRSEQDLMLVENFR